jgi:T-complex protein 1 subunit beta
MVIIKAVIERFFEFQKSNLLIFV